MMDARKGPHGTYLITYTGLRAGLNTLAVKVGSDTGGSSDTGHQRRSDCLGHVASIGWLSHPNPDGDWWGWSDKVTA